MPFETFDLGRVMQTAEAIKGMKRDAESSKIRDQYMLTTTANAQQAGQIAANQEQRAQTDQQAALDARTAKQHFITASYVESAADPVRAAQEFVPELVQAFEAKNGAGTFATLKPDQVKGMVADAKARAAAAAGIQMGATPEQQAEHQLALERIGAQGTQAERLEGVRHKNDMALLGQRQTQGQSQFRPLSPEEVQSVGLPAGTAAQVDLATGKVDVLSKRDATGGLSQKDMTVAKQKLNTVSLARQQLQHIRAKFGEIKGTMSAGPLQGRLPTPSGQAFDAAVDQMRSTLTALTRVPGVGAMSDYETKLDQAKFPDRKKYETVTEDQLNQLDNMLNAIETGYGDMLGTTSEAPRAGASGGWTVEVVK
jgi:hypothetical protein